MHKKDIRRTKRGEEVSCDRPSQRARQASGNYRSKVQPTWKELNIVDYVYVYFKCLVFILISCLLVTLIHARLAFLV